MIYLIFDIKHYKKSFLDELKKLFGLKKSNEFLIKLCQDQKKTFH